MINYVSGRLISTTPTFLDGLRQVVHIRCFIKIFCLRHNKIIGDNEMTVWNPDSPCKGDRGLGWDLSDPFRNVKGRSMIGKILRKKLEGVGVPASIISLPVYMKRRGFLLRTESVIRDVVP